MPEETNSQSNMILRELSDLKATLAVNTNDTSNIKKNIEDIKTENKLAHESLDKKVSFTNGRVGKLELWRMFLIGAWAVLSMATPIAWYFIVTSLNNFSDSIDGKIDAAIQQNHDKYFEPMIKP